MKNLALGLLLVCVASSFVTGCKKDDEIVVSFATMQFNKAKSLYDTGNYKDAKEACKLIDKNKLERSVETDKGKAFVAEFTGLCSVDLLAQSFKGSVETGAVEWAKYANDAIMSASTKASFQGSCKSADEFTTSAPTTYSVPADRPSLVALKAAVTKNCGDAAMAAVAAAAPKPTAAPTAAPTTAPTTKAVTKKK